MNGETIVLEKELSLFELLQQHEFTQKIGIAVAVNNTVVPKTNWQSFQLNNKDSILIIAATKGG